MDPKNLVRILDNASDIIADLVFIEVGEPLLVHDKLLPLVREISAKVIGWEPSLMTLLPVARTVPRRCLNLALKLGATLSI